MHCILPTGVCPGGAHRPLWARRHWYQDVEPEIIDTVKCGRATGDSFTSGWESLPLPFKHRSNIGHLHLYNSVHLGPNSPAVISLLGLPSRVCDANQALHSRTTNCSVQDLYVVCWSGYRLLRECLSHDTTYFRMFARSKVCCYVTRRFAWKQ